MKAIDFIAPRVIRRTSYSGVATDQLVARHLETTERKIEALTRLRRELRNPELVQRRAHCGVPSHSGALCGGGNPEKTAEGSSRT
jgi:hypothetical protein